MAAEDALGTNIQRESSLAPEPTSGEEHARNPDIPPPTDAPAAQPTTSKPRLWASDVNRGFDPPQGHDGAASSWSAASDKQLGSPSSTSDRVFPIRSVVSVDSSQTPHLMSGRNSGEYGEYFASRPVPPGSATNDAAAARARASSEVESRPTPHPSSIRQVRKSSTSTRASDRYGEALRMRLFSSDGESEKSNERNAASVYSATKSHSVGSRASSARDQDLSGLVTARFKHMVTAEGHAVLTGRDGDTLQRCEDEPIHIPGAVQGFGLLIALEEKDSEGELLVRVVSENSHRMIGYTPQELFKLSSFTDILSEEQCDNLLDHIDFIRDEETDPATNGPEVFTLSIRAPQSTKRSRKLWCAMHINPSHPDLIICEFELDDDQLYPLVPPNEETPEPPEDTLGSQPTEEEYAESTSKMSKPLRVLRSARKRRGEAAAMEVFNIMSQVQEQLANAPNLDKFLKILVGVVKELTGFHRVMVYQFDASFNGRVVTELVDPRATTDLYKGLNFPASDIPRQARDLYKLNKVRLLYDRDLETARLVCRSVEDLDTPVDLSFSYLRAMSPIHIKYLANMAVRSSMSISINAFNELWGLIACHCYGPKGVRVSFPIRKMCRLVGDTASRNIERLSYASRLQARKLINTVPTEANPSGYIIASSDDLLKLFDADFGLLSIRGETKIMGKINQSQEALAMLEYLRLRNLTSVITSQDIKGDFPDLRYPPGFNVIAGLLLVPLSAGGADFIVFFRRGQVKEVKWAGNPYEKFVKEGTEGYLEPRKSFKTWSETVVGKCREWTEEQVETAAVLCLVYGKFIEVWRQKEAALQSSQLTRLLLANSAHEVRTPLNAIINYLEIALEGALDQETRENLAKSHSASKSLIYVINDLLDLTKTEEGNELIKDEIFDLPATIREATESFKGDAKRKGLDYEIIEHPGVPQMVHGDQRRLRQAVANVTANAIQHTSSGWVRVETWLQELEGDRATVEIIVQDSGVGMSNKKLDALFRDLEQVTSDLEMDGLSEKSGSSRPQIGQEKDRRTLGLGLAVVARIIRNMDGQLRLKSEEGKGSRFVIQLPFLIPVEEGSDRESSSMLRIDSPSPAASITPNPLDTNDEVTLVEKGSSLKVDTLSKKHSVEEFSSLHSAMSVHSTRSDQSAQSGSSAQSNTSKKSDVDRLIDAISNPLLVGTASSDDGGSLYRTNSKGSMASGRSRKSIGSYGAPSTNSRVAMGYERPPLRHVRSYGAPEHLRSPIEGPTGSEFVQDNMTLLKAVKMPDDLGSDAATAAPHPTPRVLFDLPNEKVDLQEIEAPDKPKKLDAEHLQILVAEDDPVNSRIIQKRLEKSGHEVHHTVNGEDCASAYGEQAAFFDVVLMDMQMPIVDGLTSTKMIRSFEKTTASKLSSCAALNGRVPIFAVSASLLERERQKYLDVGFDGWILKPIDFKRLNHLLLGIVDDEVRNSCLYKPGHWERGGWFERRRPSVFEASTTPSEKSPIQYSQDASYSLDKDSGKSSDSGSITPTRLEPRRPLIYDERLDVPSEIQEVHEEDQEAAAQQLVEILTAVENETGKDESAPG